MKNNKNIKNIANELNEELGFINIPSKDVKEVDLENKETIIVDAEIVEDTASKKVTSKLTLEDYREDLESKNEDNDLFAMGIPFIKEVILETCKEINLSKNKNSKIEKVLNRLTSIDTAKSIEKDLAKILKEGTKDFFKVVDKVASRLVSEKISKFIYENQELVSGKENKLANPEILIHIFNNDMDNIKKKLFGENKSTELVVSTKATTKSEYDVPDMELSKLDFVDNMIFRDVFEYAFVSEYQKDNALYFDLLSKSKTLYELLEKIDNLKSSDLVSDTREEAKRYLFKELKKNFFRPKKENKPLSAIRNVRDSLAKVI